MDLLTLPVESIQERDIDILLLEELSVNVQFCDWFVRELGLPELTYCKSVLKSICEPGLGETDILLEYLSENKQVYVFIENKLNSPFGPRQYNRYLQRAKKAIEDGKCEEAFVVLVAPGLYCETQYFFENFLTYESIANQLKNFEDPRSMFKSRLLKIAVEKLRRGYNPINSTIVQKFWLSYWKYKEEYYPDLKMKKPGIVPHKSDWPTMYDERLANVRFYHKLAQGNVDATFKDASEELERQLIEILPDWAILKKFGRSFSIRVFSGRVNRTGDFSRQIINVDQGLKNIQRLRDWLIENQEILRIV
ncbi:MAG: hypothetical protein Kow0037_05310 [Calditrichia bacterium]